MPMFFFEVLGCGCIFSKSAASNRQRSRVNMVAAVQLEIISKKQGERLGSRSVPETPSTVGENRTMNEASRGIANLLENLRVKSPGGPACNARSSRPYSPPDEWIKRNSRKKKVLVTPKSRSTKVQMFHYDGVSFSSHSKLGFERCIIHNIPPPKKPQSYGAHGKMLRPKWL